MPDPRKDHRFYGKLQAVPSYSPENGFREGGDAPVSLSVSCTMDLQLITEVMEHTIAASEILGVDADMRPRWQAVLDNLPPQQIGSQGQLQEWLEEYDEDWDVTFTEGVGHRHCSHLYALFPGEDITATKTPELYEACRKSVEIRVTHHANDKFPWFYAALYARLKMAAQAYENIRFEELRSYPRNTHFRAGQRPVITATINEMLLQSHDGFIDLLPALPAQWASGEVSGLVARGGYECGVRWENGRLTEATITSRLGGQCDVAYLNQRMTLTMKPGETRTVRFA